MNVNNFLLSPVDLRIVNDWQLVVDSAEGIIEKSKTNYTEIKPYGHSTFYHLGQLGSVGHHHISDNWHNVHILPSPWTKKYLPWLGQLLNDMKELGPTYAISIMRGNGAEHTDYNTYPCALNYPMTTTDAYTYIKYEGQEHGYPSLIDEPWILATGYPHGVRNIGLRTVFNLHFTVDYPTVLRWFDKHPNLIYN